MCVLLNYFLDPKNPPRKGTVWLPGYTLVALASDDRPRCTANGTALALALVGRPIREAVERSREVAPKNEGQRVADRRFWSDSSEVVFSHTRVFTHGF